MPNINIDKVFSSNIGKVVAFVLAPLLAVAAAPVTHAINSVLNTGLSEQQISNVAIATIVGVAALGYKWLHNRGAWEQSVLELEKLYEAGRELVDGEQPPVEPTPRNPQAAA